MEKTGMSPHLILYAIIVSHIGWVMEMLLFYFSFGIIADRGFLMLPFCPIYGITLLAVYYLIGTPHSGGVLISWLECGGVRTIMYFLLAILIPTFAEAAVGEIMEKISGRVLWDYSGMRFNIGKYVSVESSLIWGVLILFSMLLFEPILCALSRIDRLIAKRICSVLISAITVDFIVNLVFLR